tara:strand:- start:1052 stop:1240 length:189 start_codon:yes stop_codon:yes gene_type:complete
MTTETVRYTTIGGKTITRDITISRKTISYEPPGFKEDRAYFHKVSQFQKLCKELGFNKVSLN